MPDAQSPTDSIGSRFAAGKSPDDVLSLLLEGNARFQQGALSRYDHKAMIAETAEGQSPSAIILSCIDSRVPVEQVFDVSVGDVFSARVAGNILGTKTIASIEYAVGVAGVGLVIVLGHTRCGAATAAVDAVLTGATPLPAEECEHLTSIVEEFQPSIDTEALANYATADRAEKISVVDDVATENVRLACQQLASRSPTVARLVDEGTLKIVGAMYDVGSGKVELV